MAAADAETDDPVYDLYAITNGESEIIEGA
jgi:hypothetical protein